MSKDNTIYEELKAPPQQPGDTAKVNGTDYPSDKVSRSGYKLGDNGT